MHRVLRLVPVILLLELSQSVAQSPKGTSIANAYRISTVLAEIAPGGIAITGEGEVYVTDTFRSRIHRIDRSGKATVVAGAGTSEIFLYGHFTPRPRHYA